MLHSHIAQKAVIRILWHQSINQKHL